MNVPVNQATPYQKDNLKPSITDLVFSSIRGLVAANPVVTTTRPENPEDSEEYLSKLDLALQYINGFIAILPTDKYRLGFPCKAKYKTPAETATELKEAFQIVYKLYRKHHPSIQQEDSNIVPGIGETAKDKVHALMSGIIKFYGLTGNFIFGPNLRDDDEYITSIVDEALISLIDNFNFDTSYLTVNILYEISQTRIRSKSAVTKSIIKKLDQMIEWARIPKFARYIQETENSEEIPRITKILLEILVSLLTVGMDDYREPMSDSKIIDSLAEPSDPFTATETPDPNVVHTQELIVKAYVKAYLLSWHHRRRSDDPTLFKQIYKILRSYSSQTKLTADELGMAIKVYSINGWSSPSTSTNASFIPEIIIQLYRDHLLNIDFDSPSIDSVSKELLELLATRFISSLNASSLEEGVKAVVEESFTKILTEAKTLQQVCEAKQSNAHRRVRIAENLIERFFRHLYSFLNLCKMNRKNEGASDTATSEFNQMLDAQFAKFICSPVFYMGRVSTIIDICCVWNQQNLLVIFKNHILVYAQDIVDLMNILKQQDPTKPEAEQSYLEKITKELFVSTKASKWSYELKCSRNAGEVFQTNSKLFGVAFFNLFKLPEIMYRLCGETELAEFFDILKSNVTSFIQAEQIAFIYTLIDDSYRDENTAKAKFGNLLALTKPEEASQEESNDGRHPKTTLAPPPILRFKDENLTSISTSQVNEYFDQKRRLIFRMLLNLDAQKSSEENLISRVGLMAQWERMTSQEDYSTASMIQVTYRVLLDLLDFIAQSLPASPDFTFEDLVSQHSRYMTSSSQTVHFVSQIMTVIAGQFRLITRIMKENIHRGSSVDQLSKDAETLMQNLDSISKRMLLLNVLDQIASRSSSELYIVKTALYTCHETALNILARTKRSTTRGGTSMETEKRVFRKILYTFLLGQSNGNVLVTLDKIYYGVFGQVVTEAMQLLSQQNLQNEANIGSFVVSTVYRNQVLNKVTQLHSLLKFTTSFRDQAHIDNETEHLFYLKAIEFTVSTLHGAIRQLQGSKALTSESDLNKHSFLASYESLLVLLIRLTEQKLASTYTENQPADTFLAIFSTLYATLSRWKDLYANDRDIQLNKSAVFRHQGLPHLLSVGLMSDEILIHLTSDPQMISFLIKHLRVSFYTIAEAIILKGYDLAELLAVKYKSLTHLDVEGERLTTNSLLTFFEQFYEVASKAWEASFPSKDSEQKSASDQQSTCDGKITVALQGGSSESISVLTYLKNACSEPAKFLLQTMAQDVIITIEDYIESFFHDQPQEEISPRPGKKQGPVSQRLFVLFMLVRNYPELSVVLNSSIVTMTFQFPSGYEHFVPQWNKEWTFLQFLIHYGCFFCYDEVKDFLQQLTATSQTPILVEYSNQAIPLSLHNELLIYKEILTILEKTLAKGKTWINNTYSRIVWGVLPDLCINLVSKPQEKVHCRLRRHMISKLYSLSARALELYTIHALEEPKKDEEENHSYWDRPKYISITNIIVKKLVALSKFDVAIRIKLSLLQHADFLNKAKSDDMVNVSHAIKEECYRFKTDELGFINAETSDLDLDQDIIKIPIVKVIRHPVGYQSSDALKTICKYYYYLLSYIDFSQYKIIHSKQTNT